LCHLIIIQYLTSSKKTTFFLILVLCVVKSEFTMIFFAQKKKHNKMHYLYKIVLFSQNESLCIPMISFFAVLLESKMTYCISSIRTCTFYEFHTALLEMEVLHRGTCSIQRHILLNFNLYLLQDHRKCISKKSASSHGTEH